MPVQMSSGRRAPRHLLSGRGVSGHLPSGRSACPTEAECQGKCLPDEECQGICHLDAPRVLQTQSVKANVLRTTHSTASAFRTRSVSVFFLLDAECQGKCPPDDTCHGICLPDDARHGVCFWTRSVRAFFLPDATRVLRTQCHGKCLDDAYDGARHIGNRAVTVVASRRDC